MSKLAERIADQFETKAAAEKAVKAVMEGLAAELKENGSVQVIGYLSIGTIKREGGKKVMSFGKETISKPKTFVKIKAGSKLLATVN